MLDLQNPHTVTYWAAMYEAKQAHAEWREAWAAFTGPAARSGSPEDYAMWFASGYADAAERVIRDMPVWEA